MYIVPDRCFISVCFFVRVYRKNPSLIRPRPHHLHKDQNTLGFLMYYSEFSSFSIILSFFFFTFFNHSLSLSLALSEHACPSFFKVAAKYRNPLNNSLRKQSTCRMERGIEAYRSHECDVYAPLFIFASFPFFYRLLYDSKTIVLIVPR